MENFTISYDTFLSHIEKLSKELNKKTPIGINEIQKKLEPILKEIFTAYLNFPQISFVRIRFFDIQGGLQAVDFKSNEMNAHKWCSRQSTYEEDSPATFFTPPITEVIGEWAPDLFQIIYNSKNAETIDDCVDTSYARFNNFHLPPVTIDHSMIESFDPEIDYNKSKAESPKSKKEVEDFLNRILPFTEYLKKYFPNNDEISDEAIYNAFNKSTIPKVLSEMEDNRQLITYFFPIVYAGEMVAQMTILSESHIKDAFESKQLEKAYHLIGFISHMLSSSMAKTNVDASDPVTYFHTQSLKLWYPEKIDLTDEGSHEHLLSYLKSKDIIPDDYISILMDGYNDIVEGAVLPIGDRDISKKILDSIIKKLLNKFAEVSDPSGTIKNRLEHLLIVALDNQDNLKNIPRYRQHFIHSFHVFLTGLRLIASKKDLLNSWVFEMDDNVIKINKETIVNAWFFASIFHDISYGVANVENWVNEAVRKTVLFQNNGEEDNTEIWVKHRIANLFRCENYHSALQELVKLMEIFSPDNGIEHMDISRCLYAKAVGPDQIISKADHGVLSAVMLLNATKDIWKNDEPEPWVQYAADAIACHNSLWEKEDSEPTYMAISKGKEGKNILRDLLIISDSIQQWGRTESEEALRLFIIKLNSWVDKDNGPEIRIKYALTRRIRALLKNNSTRELINIENGVNEDSLKIKDLLNFVFIWNKINYQSEQIVEKTNLPFLSKIILSLEIQRVDKDLIKEKLKDRIIDFLAEKKSSWGKGRYPYADDPYLNEIKYEWTS